MKKNILSTAVALSLILSASTAAYAEDSKMLLEVGYAAVGIEDEGFDVDVGALNLGIGIEVHENLNINANYAVGVSDDTVIVLGTPVSAELNSIFSVFFEPKTELSDGVELYGRLGYYTAEVQASANGVSISDDTSDFAYGAGLRFDIGDSAYVTPAYTVYNDDEGDVTAMSIAVGMKF